MKNPSLLSKNDKYQLSIADFSTRFYKYIYKSIESLYAGGAQVIDIIDIENFIETNAPVKNCFEQENGIQFLQDALTFSDERKFDYYYNHLKKINLLRELKKSGFDISPFYCENNLSEDAIEINQRFEELTITDILESVKRKVAIVEKDYLRGDVSETKSAYDGIEDLLQTCKERQDVGIPIQGLIINEVMSGARRGTMTIRSAPSGVGKSRNMVADCCYLAYPIRYNSITCQWEKAGSSKKVLYIATEQTRSEIQKMILAYLTGINESKFRYGVFSDRELVVINQAIEIMKEYADNFQITQMPNPTNELIKTIIREEVLLNDIQYVFYDYIFIGPALLNEFKGFNLRNDELLLILSTTLKDLAAELNIFIMTATQLNAHADDNTNIKNESSLAGGRSTINKADYGFIMSRPTAQELTQISEYSKQCHQEPNLVTDVFKVRSGEYTQLRIWSYFDYGSLRKKDLFATDSRFSEYPITINFESIPTYNEKQVNDLLERIEQID